MLIQAVRSHEGNMETATLTDGSTRKQPLRSESPRDVMAPCMTATPMTTNEESPLTKQLPAPAAVTTTTCEETTKTPQKQSQEVSYPKPFFIMDWLETVHPDDLERAREILVQSWTSPRKKSTPCASRSTGSLDAVARQLFDSSSSTPTTPRTRTCSASNLNTSESKKDNQVVSPFRKRSLEIAKAWNTKGLYHAKRGVWKDAVKCWETALDIRIQVLSGAGDVGLPPLNADVANTYNNLGIALGQLGHHEEALQHLQRALEIRTALYGRHHVEVAATLQNQGNVYQSGNSQNSLNLAVDCFIQAKEILEQCCKGSLEAKDRVPVARASVALGHAYYQGCHYPEALVLYEQALEIFQAAAFPESNMEIQAVKADIAELHRVLRQG